MRRLELIAAVVVLFAAGVARAADPLGATVTPTPIAQAAVDAAAQAARMPPPPPVAVTRAPVHGSPAR